MSIARAGVPPHDLDAEAAVLSAAIHDPAALDRVRAVLEPEHFYADANKLIYRALLSLAANGTSIDVITLANHLQATGRLEQIRRNTVPCSPCRRDTSCR